MYVYSLDCTGCTISTTPSCYVGASPSNMVHASLILSVSRWKIYVPQVLGRPIKSFLWMAFKVHTDSPTEKVTFSENGKIIPRPWQQNTLFQWSLHWQNDRLYQKFYRCKAILRLSNFPGCALTISSATGDSKQVWQDIQRRMGCA